MTIEELRVLITAKTDGLTEGVNKVKNKINELRGATDNLTSSNQRKVDKMKTQYDQLLKKLDNVNARAEIQQRKLSGLQEKFSRMGGLRTDNPKMIKLQEQILNTENRLQGLINTSDNTNTKLTDLDDKMANLGINTDKSSNKFAKLQSKIEQIKDRFKRTGNEIQRSTGKVAGFANMLDRSLRRVLRRVLVYNVIYRMLRGMMSYLNGALQTNNRFVTSLNAIRTNLRVAFQPIYDFILPAINALMRGLSAITGYIASFTSALFGKTYKQSYDAAKGIETAKKAMDGFGGSAKKAKGQLASFDEINVIQTKDDSGSGGGNDFEMEMPDLSNIAMEKMEELKKFLDELFKPFKLAWENEGQATIDKLREALGSIKALLAEIGKSFMEVWTNGTGQHILETNLRILQNIFDIIGNIAERFREAWAENEVGTRIIQGIADLFTIVFETIERITGITAEWAKTLDFTPLLESISTLLDALQPLTQNIADGLVWLWENALLPLVGWVIEDALPVFLEVLASALGVLNSVIDALKPLGLWLWEEFLKPMAEWTGDKIIQGLEWLNEKLKDFSNWIDNNQKTVETLAIIVGSFAAAWGLVNIAIGVWNVIGAIATGVTTGFGIAVGILTSPITLVIAAIGALIAIGVLLYKNWDEIGPFLSKTWESIKTKASEIWGAIKKFFIETWDGIKKKTEEIWNNIKTFLTDKIWNPIKNTATNIWDGIKNYVIGKWNDIRTGINNTATLLVNAIKSPFEVAKGWIDGIIKDAYNWGKNLIGEFIDGIKSMVGKVGDAVKGVAGKVSDFIGFRSPTKEGPGKYADKWMPNMMDMLAEGIKDNTFKIEGAVNMTANSLSNVQRPDSTNSIVNAISGALDSGGDTTIIVKIGEDTITEKVVSNINRQSRISGKTVITV